MVVIEIRAIKLARSTAGVSVKKETTKSTFPIVSGSRMTHLRSGSQVKVSPEGFGPSTISLRGSCSTTELRTREPTRIVSFNDLKRKLLLSFWLW